MTNKHLTILSALAALLLTAACSNDEETTQSTDALVEIRLTSAMEAQTRATHGLDTQLAQDETVHVWVDDTDTGDALYTDNALTVGTDGALSGGTTMYFPSTGNAVDIYAIHGNLDYTDFWGESVTHTVATDQQSTGTGYATSDLVYCKKPSVSRTNTAVELLFNHLLSKVEVVLKQGNGNPSIETVEILNTQLTATFTPAKSSDGVTVEASGDAGAIVIDNDVTADDAEDALNEAIIVPQTLASGTQFIRITTDESGVLYYKLPTDFTFAAGKKYHYTITVNLTELIVTTSITDWVDGETIQDNATMDDDYTYTEEDGVRTYTVYSEAGLLAWSEYTRSGNWDTNCTLAKDITLSTVNDGESNWTAIATYSSSSQYTGIFDGNNKTITGLTISASSSRQGLIGYLGSGGEVKNLTLAEVNIFSNTPENGAVAGNNYGIVTNCHIASGTVTGYGATGGVVGENYGTVTDCYFEGTVNGLVEFGPKNIGGVVGNNTGTVTACYSTGAVTGLTNTGGVAGYSSGTVTACYSTASVIGDGFTGGVVGNNYGSVTACYATGTVTGGIQCTGGVVGDNNGNVTACYSTGDVSYSEYGFGGVAGSNSRTISACYWYNSTTTYGIGDPESDDNATKVEGSVTWADAASAMNAVLTGWQYVENNDDNEPLTLEATE